MLDSDQDAVPDPSQEVTDTAPAEDDARLLDLPEQLCFALYSASRAYAAAYRPYLDELGLTYPQYVTMLALWGNPGVTMKELGQELRLDYGTLSPLIARLEQAGLVSSNRSPADRRVMQIRPTEQSLELRGALQNMVRTVLGGVGMSVEEIIAVRDRIKEVTERVVAFTARSSS